MSQFLTHLLPGGKPAATGSLSGRDDPWGSGMWPLHREDILGDPAEWRNDAGVALLAPDTAEDAMHVPVTLSVTPLGKVEKLVVTIDYSPIPKVLTFWPGRALSFLGFGVKYESGSPLRASVALGGGRWRMGAHYIDAMGGGCTAPAMAHDRPDWQDGFGEMRARVWPQTGRLRVWIRHPQDTGLAPGIAAHHLTEMVIEDAEGEIARVELHEPVEENPVLTFLLPVDLASGAINIRARDNLGYLFEGRVEGNA